MSDLSQHLPFSQRPRRDESAVTNNWARHTGTVLLELADLLAELSPSDWSLPSMRTDVSVQVVVGELVWRLGTPRRERAASIARQVLAERRSPATAIRHLATAAADAGPGSLMARVRELAAHDLASSASRRVGELGIAVVTAWDVAAATGRTVAIDPITSGAVALARSLSAPLPVRAVIRERRLTATDAEWSVGTGPGIDASAAVIVLFLYGRHGFPASEGASAGG